MADTPFNVTPFSEDALHEALANPAFPKLSVATHNRAKYLFGYLQAIGATTIVVEYGYTDGDYLDDFAAYYVRCFANYDRRCKRLHFFSYLFDANQLTSVLNGSASAADCISFREGYLGFSVARPLPGAIIGRTVLATYPSDGGRRKYTCVKEYEAHLFGTALKVRSLAFQEQDTVLAACATVALWSCFHKTAELFGTPLPRPAEVTRAANVVLHSSRPIPSHGLNVQQICNAISRSGLEPEVIQVRSDTPLVSLMYAYVNMGIPVLLGVRIEGRGLHAVALAGFSINSSQVLTQEVGGRGACIPMTGLHINEFYAHDDQIGPFSRMQIKLSATVDNKVYPVHFESSWTDPGTGKVLSMYPEVVIVPVYNKIRLTFTDIRAWITRLHPAMRLLFKNASGLRWDISLTTANQYKESQKSALAGSNSSLIDKLLVSQLPRFVWRASLYDGTRLVLDLIADATDISKSLPMLSMIVYHRNVQSALKAMLSNPKLQAVLNANLSPRFLEFLLVQL